MSDQELDDLFKEASAKYEAPFDEKEWDKMAALLDKPTSPRPGFWNWKIISGLALLLLMSGTVMVTQWDKISDSVDGSNRENEVSMHSADSLSSVKEIQTVSDKQNLAAQENNTVGEKDNQKVIEAQSENQSQINELSQSTTVSQNKSLKIEQKKNTELKENTQQENTSDQFNVRAIAENRKNGTVAKEVVTTNKKNESESKQSNRTKQVGNVTDKKEGTAKKNDAGKISSSLATQQLSPKGEEDIVIATAKGKIKSSDDKEPLIALSGNEKDESESNALVTNNNKDKTIALIQESKSIPLAKEVQSKEEQGGKERSGESTTDDNLLTKQNDALNNSIVSRSAVKKENGEGFLDSTKVISSQEKKDSLVSKEVKKEEKKKSDSLSKLHRFSVKLALSPDFSSVGYFKPGKTGFNYGLLAEYNITRHWSVTLGGIWSRKIYANTKREVDGSVVHLTEMNGKCRVLDLPLNINYYIMPTHGFTLYGSVGVSSYIMFNEDYDYYYTNGTSSYSYSSQYKKGNKEFFKMMNVSIGIQQQLSPRVRLQLEPFIKAPLSGIGGGDLKLVSSGVFLNLKYTFK